MNWSWNNEEFKQQSWFVAEKSGENIQLSLIQQFDSAEFQILHFQWLIEPNNLENNIKFEFSFNRFLSNQTDWIQKNETLTIFKSSKFLQF